MTDCYCEYSHVEFYHVETRKARKGHNCGECGRIIRPGETYEHVRGKCEGYCYFAKTCSLCLTLRKWMTAHVPCFCWSHHDMRQAAEETIREYAHECPGLWFGWARREVAIRQARQASIEAGIRRRESAVASSPTEPRKGQPHD